MPVLCRAGLGLSEAGGAAGVPDERPAAASGDCDLREPCLLHMEWKFLGEPAEMLHFSYLGEFQHTARRLEPECPNRESPCREERPPPPAGPQLAGCDSTPWPEQDPGLMRDAPGGMDTFGTRA